MKTALKTTNRLVLSTAGLCLAYFAASCGSKETPEEPSANGGKSGAGVAGSSAAGRGGSAGSGVSGSGVGAGAGGAGAQGGANTAGTGVTSGAGGTGTAGGGAGGSGAISGAGGSDASGGTPGLGGAGAGGTGLGGESGTTGGGGAGGMTVVERPGLVTSGPNAFWQTGTLTAATGAATITVNPNTTHQNWIGFGGTFNEAGWDALGELTPAERDRAIRLLFSATEGANFKWGRIPMGASDYAMDRYTLNETADDFAMTSFSIARDRMRLIPFIKAAQAVKSDIRFWASPWTPPSWMKDPEKIDGTDAGPNGSPAATYEAFMRDDDQILTAYALYFARFVEEYATEGIPIDGVYPQNEPGYSTRYPSCRWASGLLGKFVGDYLGPTFEMRNLETDIWFGTLSNNDATIYSGNIGGLTGDAAEYCVGVGLQWNTMPHVAELAQRGFLIMQTEHRCGNYPFTVAGAPTFNPDKPQNDYAYAIESWGYIRDWLKAGVNSYSAWNMVLDTVGKNLDAQRPWPQNALLIVDRATNTLIETPVYHLFRHFSYFIDPGATRVEATGGDAVAFKNPDGSLIAVVYNSGMQPAMTTVAMGSSTFQVQVPGQGFATLNFKGP